MYCTDYIILKSFLKTLKILGYFGLTFYTL